MLAKMYKAEIQQLFSDADCNRDSIEPSAVQPSTA